MVRASLGQWLFIIFVCVAIAGGASATAGVASNSGQSPSNASAVFFASCTAGPTEVNVGETVTIDASASDSSYLDFDIDGDGTYERREQTDFVQTVSYSDSGSYELIVRDDTGELASCGVVTVNAPPEADLTFSPGTGTAGQPIEFDASASTDPDGEVVQYNWDWDGDEVFEETTAEPVVNHTYFESGFQNVILRVDDDDGAQGFTSRDVEVVEPTVAARCSVEPSTVTVGESVLIDARTSENVSYVNYDVHGDGEYDYFERTELTLTHTYEQPGEYAPIIEVIGPTRQQDIEECGVVTVESENDPPEADFTYDPQPGVTGQAIEFDASVSTDPDGTVNRYEWDFDADGIYEETTTDPVIKHTYFEAGFENVALRVRDAQNATGFTTRDVEVVEPNLQVACTVQPVTVAPGEDVTIIVERGENTLYLDYDFDGDEEYDRIETDAFTQTTSYDEPGTYTPAVRVYGTGVSEEFPCTTVTVEEPNEPPNALFTVDPSGPTTDGNVTFDATNSSDSDGQVVTYAWDFDGDGTFDRNTSSPTVVHSYADADSYVPRLVVVDDDNATDEMARDLSVEQPPNEDRLPSWWPIPAIGGGLLGLGGLGYHLFGGGGGTGGGGGNDRPKPKPKPRPQSTAQGTRYETGVFELPRSSGPVSVPVGFEPDLVLFTAANGARTDSATDRTAGWTRGIAHRGERGTANQCLTVADDAHATDQATCAAADDLAIQVVRHEADSPPSRVTARVTETTSDGFKLDVSVPGDDPLAGGIRVLYRAFRTGSDVDVEVGTAMTATEPGIQTVDLGIDADHVSLAVSAAVSDEDQLWTTDRGVGVSVGYAVADPESPIDQVVAGTSVWPGTGHPTAGVAGDVTALNLLYQDGDRLGGRTSASVTALGETLRLQYDRAYNGPHKLGSIARHPISYLALAGGETMRPTVGTFSLPRPTETRTIDCGFEPAMVELTIAPAPLGKAVATGATAHPFGWSHGTAIATGERLRQYVLHHAVVTEPPATRAGGVNTDATGEGPSQASTDGGRATDTGEVSGTTTLGDTAEMDVQPRDPQQFAESVSDTGTGTAPVAADHTDDERAGLWLARSPDGTIVGRDELSVTEVTESGFEVTVESVDTDRRGPTGIRPTVVYRAWPAVDVAGQAGDRTPPEPDDARTTGEPGRTDEMEPSDPDLDPSRTEISTGVER